MCKSSRHHLKTSCVRVKSSRHAAEKGSLPHKPRQGGQIWSGRRTRSAAGRVRSGGCHNRPAPLQHKGAASCGALLGSHVRLPHKPKPHLFSTPTLRPSKSATESACKPPLSISSHRLIFATRCLVYRHHIQTPFAFFVGIKWSLCCPILVVDRQ